MRSHRREWLYQFIHLVPSINFDEQKRFFLTTHSPVALRERSGAQLFVLRRGHLDHEARLVGTDNDIQSTIRL